MSLGGPSSPARPLTALGGVYRSKLLEHSADESFDGRFGGAPSKPPSYPGELVKDWSAGVSAVASAAAPVTWGRAGR